MFGRCALRLRQCIHFARKRGFLSWRSTAGPGPLVAGRRQVHAPSKVETGNGHERRSATRVHRSGVLRHKGWRRTRLALRVRKRYCSRRVSCDNGRERRTLGAAPVLLNDDKTTYRYLSNVGERIGDLASTQVHPCRQRRSSGPIGIAVHSAHDDVCEQDGCDGESSNPRTVSLVPDATYTLPIGSTLRYASVHWNQEDDRCH